MSRIYLLSSLPTLALGQDPPMSLEAFLRQCTILGMEEQAEIGRIIQGRHQDLRTGFGQAWRDLDLQIRHQIMIFRTTAWNVQSAKSEPSMSRLSVRARDVVNDALELDSPLEREWALDKGRWVLIQDLTSPDDVFGLDRVLAYGLRLKLVHRWGGMDRMKGRERFQALVKSCMDEAQMGLQAEG